MSAGERGAKFASQLPGGLFGEGLGQQGYVISAFPQGRQGQWKHVESKVEVLPEAACIHSGPEVSVGGRNDPDIHLLGPGGTHRLELALLEGAQKFGLEVQIQVRHLVQEQGAAVGQSESSQPPLGGAGEGALFVTEKFALHEAIGNCCAIDPDQRCILAPAAFVDGPGNQFLAGAGFTVDEHGRIGVGDLVHILEQPHERYAGADDVVEITQRADLRLQPLGLPAEGPDFCLGC